MKNVVALEQRCQKRARGQVASEKEEPRTQGKGVALVREHEECTSLCIEHNRDPREYEPEEDFFEGEADEKRKDRKSSGQLQAYALDRVRTQLIEARAQVKHLQDLEEELWKHLHPICRWVSGGAAPYTGRTIATGAGKGGYVSRGVLQRW